MDGLSPTSTFSARGLRGWGGAHERGPLLPYLAVVLVVAWDLQRAVCLLVASPLAAGFPHSMVAGLRWAPQHRPGGISIPFSILAQKAHGIISAPFCSLEASHYWLAYI